MESEQHFVVTNKTFISVWAALVALTVITVLVAQAHKGNTSVLVPLVIATTKASLVLWYFMHLKYEKKLFKLMLLVPIITLLVILGLTFLDIWFR